MPYAREMTSYMSSNIEEQIQSNIYLEFNLIVEHFFPVFSPICMFLTKYAESIKTKQGKQVIIIILRQLQISILRGDDVLKLYFYLSLLT